MWVSEMTHAAGRAAISEVVEELKRAHEAGDLEASEHADVRLHTAIVNASHNAMLIHMMRSIYELLVRGVWYNRSVVYSLRERRAALLDQHRAIRDAILARDPRTARAAVNAHMDFVEQALREANRARTREQVAALRHDHEMRRTARGRTRKAGSA